MHRDQNVPRTCLASMPWHSLNRPSLALGILRAACAREGLPVPVSYHGSLEFAAAMVNAGFAVSDYAALADTGYHYSLGEWTFAGALYHPEFGVEGMRDLARRNNLPLRTAQAARELAEPFVDQAVDAILAHEPELVGFSCTFSQTIASLAVARRIKQRRPDVQILIGGYSADGPMGAALHREFPFVDFVLRGEADTAFPRLLTAIAEHRANGTTTPLEAIPQLCWRDIAGAARVNSRPAPLVPPGRMTAPDYGDWFERFPPVLRGHVIPELVVESSRGCWWGEKHHCTFCGLNGSGMTHRAKPAESFVAEVTELVRRHKVLDVTMIDNILPVEYYRTALPDFADTDFDWKFHYEIKANIRADDVEVLRAARVWGIQPGIESLVDDVLRRMDKGVRAVHNVRMIRDGSSAGLGVTWNWLHGFPGERLVDYQAVIAQIPALVHLQPPDGLSRINLQRFSPNFDRPALGFTERWAAEASRYVYDIPPQRLDDLVYSFDTPDQGLTTAEAAPLTAALGDWKARYPASVLAAREFGDMVVIRDRRVGWPAADYVMTDPDELTAWRALESGRTPLALFRELAGAGVGWTEGQVKGWLRMLQQHGLVFVGAGAWISLPTTPDRADRARVAAAPRVLLPITPVSA